jgi:hypothetical protein
MLPRLWRSTGRGASTIMKSEAERGRPPARDESAFALVRHRGASGRGFDVSGLSFRSLMRAPFLRTPINK